MSQIITVTLEEVKEALNLQGVTIWDTLLNSYILAASSKAKIDCSQNYDAIVIDNDKTEVLKQCIKILVGDFFQNRNSETDMKEKSSVAYDTLIKTVRLTNSC